MKFMTALAVFVLSSGLAWGAAEPAKKELSAAQQEEVAKTKTAVKAEKKAAKKVAEKKAPSPAQKAQQEKMKTCNAEASKQGLKGDERKAFISNCLKKDK